MEKRYDLSRFISAQQRDYATALREIQGGRKRSHWMWYIFPQLKGLGMSYTAQLYGIDGLGEARAFLADPYLGANLREICGALLGLGTNDASYVFGYPDDLKLRSSMTLFKLAADDGAVFDAVLKKFYGGREDQRTRELLGP